VSCKERLGGLLKYYEREAAMSLRSGKPPFLGSEDEFFYHTTVEQAILDRITENAGKNVTNPVPRCVCAALISVAES
jgi:hypothetical protein